MKRLWKPRIGQKVLLTVLGVAVPAILTFSIFIINSTGEILRANVTRQVQQLAAKSALGLQDLVWDSEVVLSKIVESPDVRELLFAQELGDPAATVPAIEDLEASFLDFQRLDPSIQAIRYIDAEGRVLVKVREGRIIPRTGPQLPGLPIKAVNSLKARDFFRNTMALGPGEIWISNMERGRVEGEDKWCPAMVRFSMPLFLSGGSRAGAVVINVWGQSAGDMINRLISPIEGSAFLVERNFIDRDRNGIYLFHQNSTCEFGNQTGSRITVTQEYPQEITEAWMREEEGVLIHPESKDILAHKFISPYGRSDRGWVVVVNAKEAFFLKPLATIKERVLWYAALVLLLAFCAAFFFSRSLVRPIQAVIEGTRRIGTDLGARIKVGSKDELGSMAGEINHMAASLQENIEEKRRVEMQVCHAEKLASIGEMAAGLAHELNTPLGNINALASLAKKELAKGNPDPAAFGEDLADISEQTEKCSGIIRGLLSFARAPKPDWTLHDVNHLMGEALTLVRLRQEQKSVRVEFERDEELPFVKADGTQIQQVFVNILLNAIDAMEPGGRITIGARLEGGKISVAIADDGRGIAAEDQCRIFDPFFTTKEVGKGTGLGLSVSYGIVKNHGGAIEVESTPGEGSLFTVTLPVGGI